MSEVPLYLVAVRARGEGHVERDSHPVTLAPLLLLGAMPLYRNVQWFRGGLVFEAHRLVYHSA